MPTALPFDVDTAGLPPLVIRGRRLLPIVQGGMGVGVSAHRPGGHRGSFRRRGHDRERRPAPPPPGPAGRNPPRRQGGGRCRQPDRARPGNRRGARARRGTRHDRGERHARRVRICGQRAAGLRQRCRCHRRRRRTSARPAGPGRRPPGRRADPDPVRRPRRVAGREEMGAQGTAAGCDRDRASPLRGRTSRRRPRRGPGRSRASTSRTCCPRCWNSSGPKASPKGPFH